MCISHRVNAIDLHAQSKPQQNRFTKEGPLSRYSYGCCIQTLFSAHNYCQELPIYRCTFCYAVTAAVNAVAVVVVVFE